jgi:LacI family transcriptional regulator
VTRQSSDTVAIDDPAIAEAVRFIRRHSREPISVKQLLQAVPISRRYLEQRFLRILGRTPKAEIMRLKMELAKEFLEETELSIPAVAERSGFACAATFIRAFARTRGETPMRYRRGVRGRAE